MTQTYILGESVFALSFNRKCGNFQRNRDFDNTISSVFACVYPTLNDTGVGIVSVYLFQGFTTASVKINESAPHFLCTDNRDKVATTNE